MKPYAACVALAAVACVTSAQADCRLALLLAVDVSNSVNATEDALQRKGLSNALNAANVKRAVFVTDQTVALAAFEWSGRHHQQVMLDWTILKTPADLSHAVRTITHSKRGQIDFPTVMGHALTFGAEMFAKAPNCLFQTLDVAGDGKSNTGYPPKQAYADPAYDEITVNGLVVRVMDLGMDLGVTAYYEAHVKHGPDAFVEIADGFEDYTRAMTGKLLRELSPTVLSARPASDHPG